jgi:hypothetical protein
LDAIKEQIHHDTFQSSAPTPPIGLSPLAIQSESATPAALQTVSIGSPLLATQSEPRPLVAPPAPVAPQAASAGFPPLTTQPESASPESPAVPQPPQPDSTGSSPLATESEPRPLAELLMPQEPFAERPSQVSQPEPAVPTKSLPPAWGPAGQIIKADAALGDPSASARNADPIKAIAIRLNPKLAADYCGRGIAYGQKGSGSYDKAITAFTEAICLDPKSVQAFHCRGVTYYYKGNHDMAIADFNQAIRLDPKLAVAYYGRGCAYWHCGLKAKAEEDFAHAKTLGYAAPKLSPISIIQMSFSALTGVQ